MSRGRRLGIVVLLLVWASGAAFSLAKPPVGSFVPDASAGGAPALDGDAFHVEGPELGLRIALLDDAGRQKFLHAKTGIETDPFLAEGRPQGPGFLTFLLELENRGKGAIYFQPLVCPITTPQGDIRSPLDTETLQATYEMLDSTLPPAYAKVARALFAEQRTIAPGEKTSGLLVYRTADLRTRTLRLEVQATTASGDVIELHLPYRFVKQKSGQKGAGS